MKPSIARYFVVFAVLTLVLAGCKARENAASGGTTATIAPAEPQPAPTGSDAMTETVDIEDSRSEAEGAALTETTGTTTTRKPPASSPPPTTTTR